MGVLGKGLVDAHCSERLDWVMVTMEACLGHAVNADEKRSFQKDNFVVLKMPHNLVEARGSSKVVAQQM
jgi:hypothetical protein